MALPYLENKMGTGMNASEMKPSKEFPHPRPSDAKSLGPASGSRAPNRDREATRTALPDAA